MSNAQSNCTSPEWWNERLKIATGNEIVELLKTIPENPFAPEQGARETLPIEDALSPVTVLRMALWPMEIQVEDVSFVSDPYLIARAITANLIPDRFEERLRRFRLQILTAEEFAILRPASSAFSAYWENLEEKWSAIPKPGGSRPGLDVQMVFHELLFGAVLFTALRKGKNIVLYQLLIELCRKGIYPIGQMENGNFICYFASDEPSSFLN